MTETRKIYLTTDEDEEKGGYVAVISLGSPQMGDKEVVVLSVSRQETEEDAREWYREQMELKPWETRQ